MITALTRFEAQKGEHFLKTLVKVWLEETFICGSRTAAVSFKDVKLSEGEEQLIVDAVRGTESS